MHIQVHKNIPRLEFLLFQIIFLLELTILQLSRFSILHSLFYPADFYVTAAQFISR